ncbi:MAG: hypothetical protein K6F66_00090 [Pseudobutyrivibrio sp.]|nr:hypothetical protein [Pseudobutyrivibrio sp.]
MAKYNIGGYIFDDENKAKKAAKELKAVEYVLGQIKDADERGVLTVYKKLLNQRLFSTEIGMGFLSQLRQNLLATGAFTDDEIPEVYTLESTDKSSTEQSDSSAKPNNQKADKSDVAIEPDVQSQVKKLKTINRILLVICLTLLLCVIGMFYVNSTINSPTILNYEEELINKYSSWEQELTQREAAVKQKELEQQ